MDIFVKKYQPEKYDVWIMGLENQPHPEDYNHHQTMRQRSNSSTNDHSYAENSCKPIGDSKDCLLGGKRLPSSDSLNLKRKISLKIDLNKIKKENERRKTLKFSTYINNLSFIAAKPIEINNRKVSIKQVYFDLISYEKFDALNRLSLCDTNAIYKEIKELKMPNILVNSILLLNEVNNTNRKSSLKQLARDHVLSLLIESKNNIIQELNNVVDEYIGQEEELHDEYTKQENEGCEFSLTQLKEELEESGDIEEELEEDDDDVDEDIEYDQPQRASYNYQTANDVINSKCKNSFNEFVKKEKNRNYSKFEGLWNFQDANINLIREWNSKESSNYPHCSICLLFKYKPNLYSTDEDHLNSASETSSSTDLAKSNSDLCISTILNENENKLKLKITTQKKVANDLKSLKALPKNSEVIIPEMCFTKHSKTGSKLPDFQRDKIDCLLQCKNCNLTVHQSCYFGLIDESLINKSAWLCNVCLSKAFDEAYCCLCLLRGGALKRTTDKKKWVHLTCTLCISEVSIKDASSRLLFQIPKKLLNDKKTQVNYIFSAIALFFR